MLIALLWRSCVRESPTYRAQLTSMPHIMAVRIADQTNRWLFHDAWQLTTVPSACKGADNKGMDVVCNNGGCMNHVAPALA